MHNVLQILGHEMAHHSDLFLDETYETEMWFEEGMAEYISRRYFLTDEEYAAEKETNRILSALYDEKFGRPKLNDFHAPLTDGILCIFLCLLEKFSCR